MGYREPEFLPWDGRRVPITFVGGYLGAGKTTAINDLLAHSDRPIAVIVNDVGSINIDAALIRKRHGDTIEMTNGCVCCSAIDGMGAAFDQIRARTQPPEHVIVELSGVAEPERMLPWGNSAGFMLDGVVVVVGADQLMGTLPETIQQYISAQIACADLLILTKMDLFEVESRAFARRRLQELAPNIPVLNSAQTLGSGTVGRFLALGGYRPGGSTAIPAPTLFDAHEVQSSAVPFALTRAELEAWLLGLSARVDGTLVRAKGIVQTIDAGLLLVQIVGPRCELTSVPQAEQQQPTDLVVIRLKP